VHFLIKSYAFVKNPLLNKDIYFFGIVIYKIIVVYVFKLILILNLVGGLLVNTGVNPETEIVENAIFSLSVTMSIQSIFVLRDDDI